MSWLVFLHVLAMFIGFAFTTGSGIALGFALESNDVNFIRGASETNRRLGMIGGISLIIGLILGFAVTGQLGLPMTATWLVVSYVCVVILLIIGFGVLMPYVARLSAAAAASGAQASPELKALLAQPTLRIAGPIAGLMWIIIIAMMVLKP
jgi:Predicted integral membrane protein (DUF2269)